jgi:hypothetical protein
MVVVVQLQMVFQILLLLCSIDAVSVQAVASAINSSCQKASCGKVSDIPFPFGIGAGCYLDPWFEVVCTNGDSRASPRPVLKKLHLEVLNISLGGTVRVNYPTFVTCDPFRAHGKLNTELAKIPFIFSQSQNKFVAIGCNNFASMLTIYDPNETNSIEFVMGGCMSICVGDNYEVMNGRSCNGINCCQTTIPSYLNAFNTSVRPVSNDGYFSSKDCNSAILVEEKWLQKRGSINMSSNIMSYVPVVL